MSPKRVSEFNVQRSSLMIPRRPYFALVAALLMVWALALVLCLSSLLFQERPNDSENISRVRLWNSVNNILEEVISEHLARRNPHVPSASGTSHRMSRDTIARTAAFQDSLGFNEKQEWEKQLPFRFSKRGPKISNRRQKQSSSSTSANTTALAAKFCSVLSSKKLLFVGSENTFYLHSLWLDALGKYRDQRYHCRGPEFCTFHHICESPPNVTEPFIVSQRFKKHPTEKELLAGGSSILRYTLSNSLHISDDQKDLAYTRPVVDAFSGVRVRNSYWLGHAKRADVILLGRTPLPAPAWSYVNDGTGWDWVYDNHTYRNQSWPYLEDNQFGIRIIKAALLHSLISFLPTTIRSLDLLQMTPNIQQKILVWHGSWYRYGQCSEIRSSKTKLFVEDLLGPIARTPAFIDPWGLYYNAQGTSFRYFLIILFGELSHLDFLVTSLHPKSSHGHHSTASWYLFSPYGPWN